MKPRHFSILALLVTIVGGVVTGSWLSDRKQRLDNHDFVEWVNSDDVRAALSGLQDFGAAATAVNFTNPPSRNLDLEVENHQIASVTAYLENHLPAADPVASMTAPSGSIIHHAGQWIDLRPSMQTMVAIG